jgi:hypothetical protein
VLSSERLFLQTNKLISTVSRVSEDVDEEEEEEEAEERV